MASLVAASSSLSLHPVENHLYCSSERENGKSAVSAMKYKWRVVPNSRLFGAPLRLPALSLSKKDVQQAVRGGLDVVATATLEKPVIEGYKLPSWASFEMGHYPVFWETATGRPPASGEMLTIYFNPSATDLDIDLESGAGFTGGFNAPLLMCGGEPRGMALKSRGPNCDPLYVIKVNVPIFAMTMEFSFTDGKKETDTYTLAFELPAKWRNLPVSFFHENLKTELENGSACADAIFPDTVSFADRCIMPAALLNQDAAKCDLDLVAGCTDPESPFYDPWANVDDGSCPADFSD